MKSSFLPLLATLVTTAASLASASTNVTYTASADPNLSPDSNNNTVNAWTLTRQGDTAGQSTTYSGSYEATGVTTGMLGTAWAIYSNDNYTPTTGTAHTTEVDQNGVFPGGALSIGQTVSIDFLANSVDTGQQYGLRLLNGTAFTLSLSFIGGDGGYRYYDGSTGGTIPFGYQQNGFHFAYTQNTATTYTVVASTIGGGGTGTTIGTFSGTDGAGGAPNTLQIYNLSAGSNNNVLTNNFAIAPEPSSFVYLGGGLGMLLFIGARRRTARLAH